LILETKGFDELEEVKLAAAERWGNAVSADGACGRWSYAVAKRVADVRDLIEGAYAEFRRQNERQKTEDRRQKTNDK
jgi:type III restriction enzyme